MKGYIDKRGKHDTRNRRIYAKESLLKISQAPTVRPFLITMYITLFGIEPLPRKTRLDLSYAILNFIQDMERTADLCKSLH